MKFSLPYCLMLLLSYCCYQLPETVLATENVSTNMISDFQNSFKRATPKERRDLVIAAIDNGFIKRGLNLGDAKAMFGSDIQIFPLDSPKGRINAVVFFTPIQVSTAPVMSALRQGWYVDMVFSSNGKLDHYSLSNLHK